MFTWLPISYCQGAVSRAIHQPSGIGLELSKKLAAIDAVAVIKLLLIVSLVYLYREILSMRPELHYDNGT